MHAPTIQKVPCSLPIIIVAKVCLHLLHLPPESQDLPFRQADKHMHMHARIDEVLRLPDQREWNVRD
jgi:hypothetical protein